MRKQLTCLLTILPVALNKRGGVCVCVCVSVRERETETERETEREMVILLISGIVS